MAEPLVPPLHNTFVLADMFAVMGVGCVIVTVAVPSQPFASVTVTVYVPADNPVAVEFV